MSQINSLLDYRRHLTIAQWESLAVLSCMAAFLLVPQVSHAACEGGAPDGIVAAAEACDDGNGVAGDGCDGQCDVEATWDCSRPIDFSQLETHDYPGSGADWTIAPDGRSAVQNTNTLAPFIATFGEDAQRGQYSVSIEELAPETGFNDDDWVGLALGFQPGDQVDPNADWILLDWRQGEQAGRPAGLRLAHVRGAQNEGRHARHSVAQRECPEPGVTCVSELTPSPLNPNYDISRVDAQAAVFNVTYRPDRLIVFLDGEVEYDLRPGDFPGEFDGDQFPGGQIAFYGLSQARVRFENLTPAGASVCNRAVLQDASAIVPVNSGAFTLDVGPLFTSERGALDSDQIGIRAVQGAATALAPRDGAPVASIVVTPDDLNVAQTYIISYRACDDAPVVPACADGRLTLTYSGDADGDGVLDDIETQTGTDPTDPDTDDDGLCDGNADIAGVCAAGEDIDGDGQVDVGESDPRDQCDPDETIPECADADDDGLSDSDETNGTGPLLGYGPTDPTSSDTDGDGIQDGTEVGLTVGARGTDPAIFVPDSDPSSTTNPLDADTDDDGLADGEEDVDANGAVDAGETDPTHGDSDADGLFDGTELGNVEPVFGGTSADGTPFAGTTTTSPSFVIDLDPSTTSAADNPDTDADGLCDGPLAVPLACVSGEDANADGRTDHVLGDTGTLGAGETDPTTSDTDGDGLGDGDERLGVGASAYITDPLDRDTDDGGVDDGKEVLVDATDPTQPLDDRVDSDGDGLSDGAEIIIGSDPQNPDTDGDGLSDGAEVVDHETDPTDPDTDNDGLDDGTEVSVSLTDPTDPDNDDDGLSDHEEFIGYGTDPQDPDSDGDGLSDGSETKTYGSDPRSEDTDNDGLRDGDEVDTYGTDPTNVDSDNDDLSDGDEVRSSGPVAGSGPTDPLNPDTDLDGLDDGDEVTLTQTDPLNPDTDSGGEQDGAEVETGRDPLQPNDDLAAADDTDGDGLPDADEVALGTDPDVVDTDRDGIPDGEEVEDTHSDPQAADTDGDGLEDGAERDGNTDPLDRDSDNDGLDDGLEIALETDPRDPDSDNDGLLDGEEVNIWRTNPLDPDTDSDGLNDGAEVDGADGQRGTNDETDPLRPDTDGDTLSDGDEVAAYGSNPLDPDTDSGGVRDGVEVEVATDPRDPADDVAPIDALVDTDGDGLADFEEAELTETSSTNPDTDGDGLSDGAEVLDYGTDPNDADTDGDGLPDGREVEDGRTDPLRPDTDGDGLGDGAEIAAAVPTDPTNPDTDGDGLEDGDEVLVYATSPTDRDSDDDLLDDGAEVRRHRSDPNDPDTDRGGVPDGTEVLAGTDPLDRSDDDPSSDSDGDGLPDGVERDAGTDPLDPDTDNDGLSDGIEIPDGIYDEGVDSNPVDADTDDDGIADGEEVASGDDGVVTDPVDPDTDGDGLSDGVETGVTEGIPPGISDGVGIPFDGTDGAPDFDTDPGSRTDPTDGDTDGDGRRDGSEDANNDGAVGPGETDPNVPDAPEDEPEEDNEDSDDDGLTDDLEAQIGTDPTNRDTDGDGLDDGLEVSLGTDPTVPLVLSGGPSACTSVSSADGSLWLLILGMGFLGRRRSRRRMAAFGKILTLALLVAMPSLVQAQVPDPQGFDGNRLRPAMSRAGVLTVESAETQKHLEIEAALWYNYANDPLVLNEGGDRVLSLLKSRHEMHLVASIGLFGFLEIGIDAPVTLSQSRGDRADAFGLSDIRAAGLGDIALTPKVKLLNREEFFVDVALLARLTLPTATTDGSYLGARRPTFAPEIAVSTVIGGLTIATNAAILLRETLDAPPVNTEISDELVLRLGVAYDFQKSPLEVPVRLNAAVEAFTTISDPFSQENLNGAEWLASVDYRITPYLEVFGGFGTALSQGYGIPDWRTFGGIRFFYRRGDVGDGDGDGDGLSDSVDQCPDEPEDRDGFNDCDGCPDPDNDGDGILDPVDEAPLDPEDHDGFEDQDGRPDPDNDGDGVLDPIDRCPLVSGIAEHEGCPPPMVVRGCRIELNDKVYFETNRSELLIQSRQLLAAVAKILNEKTELSRIRVEGHTDSVGRSSRNLTLSRARARAVRDYLVKSGVEQARLRSVGRGERKPVATNKTSEGQATNRRVEFHIEDCVEAPSPQTP